ncbi:hypothetical protein EC968_007796 [Mortierella alpina]|nr:hypothetical protein EC968_007796 [Mortierella alpina]
MKLIHIVLPKDLKLSSFQAKGPAPLRNLSFEMIIRSTRAKEFGILAKTLKINSILTTLNLWGNWLGDKEAQALSEALKTNSTLTTLGLRYNSIGDKGAQALSEALKTNCSLTTLHLTSNWFGDNGAQALSEALKTNSTHHFGLLAQLGRGQGSSGTV